MTLRAEATAAALDKAINARQNAYYAKYAPAQQQDIISVMKSFYQTYHLPTEVNVSNPTSKPEMLIALRAVIDSETSAIQAQDAEHPPLGGPVETNPFGPTGYTFPVDDSIAQNFRAQISLMDQQFAQFMASQNLDNLKQVFTNELQGIDLDVKQLQIAYISIQF